MLCDLRGNVRAVVLHTKTAKSRGMQEIMQCISRRHRKAVLALGLGAEAARVEEGEVQGERVRAEREETGEEAGEMFERVRWGGAVGVGHVEQLPIGCDV